jgi:hypothetical protein
MLYKRHEACVAPPVIKYSQGKSIAVPAVANTKEIPSSIYKPTKKFLSKTYSASPPLPKRLLTAKPGSVVTTHYPISPAFGVQKVADHTLSKLTTVPRISRDGGRGGYLNGQHIFVFCDTGTFTPGKGDIPTSFRSSSVAVDVGRKAIAGTAAVLRDPVGQWESEVGSQRGFIPLTKGEDAYNLAMAKKNVGYHIWAGSSLTPYNCSTAIMFPAIVFVTGQPSFEHVGNTLTYVSNDEASGPIATRKVKLMFKKSQVAWGSFGAIRSWGADGIGGNAGKLYLIGNTDSGLAVARVDSLKVETQAAYRYWDGSMWARDMPSATTAHTIMDGSFSSGDIFYSPHHRTYLFVYMNGYADSTFYFRYLVAPTAIVPEEGVDMADAIVKYPWSSQQTLLKVPEGKSGQYAYAGGVQLGYFGVHDITNGGKKMLLSWSSPTGQGGDTELTQYELPTAQITWE